MAIGLVRVILYGLSLKVEKVLIFPVEIDKSLIIAGERTLETKSNVLV
jgi:hypothetical protein